MYEKAVIAFLYAAFTGFAPLWTGDHRYDAAETVATAIAVVTAVAVYLVPLAPGAPWTKSVVGFLLAGLNVAAVVILDGVIDVPEWLMIVTAALAAVGIQVAPAESPATGIAVGVGSDRAI